MDRIKKIKDFFLYFLGFDKPRAIVLNLSLILYVLAVIPLNILSKGPSLCIFKNFILPLVFHGICPAVGFFAGCNCPACGMTRALSSIMHGNFSAAWVYNKLSFVVFSIMVVLIIVNIIKLMKENRKDKKF
jgi:hypothetical protein